MNKNRNISNGDTVMVKENGHKGIFWLNDNKPDTEPSVVSNGLIYVAEHRIEIVGTRAVLVEKKLWFNTMMFSSDNYPIRMGVRSWFFE